MIVRLARPFAWCTAAGLVVLAARAVAYALAPQPTPLSLELERSAGGPRLLVLTAVVLGCGLVTAVGVVGVAALAVRERLALERAPVLSPPHIRPLRLARRSTWLFVTTAAAFALLESYLHLRSGLGWHGLHCLTGPVHRDALPILVALSLVAAAVVEAIEHLVAWARRTFSRFPQRPRPRSLEQLRPPIDTPTPTVRCLGAALPARGPPAALGRPLTARAASDI